MSDETKLTEEQLDQIIDHFLERLENDPAVQQKLLGIAMKGLGGFGGLFGGGSSKT